MLLISVLKTSNFGCSFVFSDTLHVFLGEMSVEVLAYFFPHWGVLLFFPLFFFNFYLEFQILNILHMSWANNSHNNLQFFQHKNNSKMIRKERFNMAKNIRGWYPWVNNWLCCFGFQRCCTSKVEYSCPCQGQGGKQEKWSGLLAYDSFGGHAFKGYLLSLIFYKFHYLPMALWRRNLYHANPGEKFYWTNFSVLMCFALG